MNSRILFPNGLCFQLFSRQDLWLRSLRSFIQEIAEGVKQSKQLEIVVHEAAKNQPQSAQYFNFDWHPVLNSSFLREEYLFSKSNPFKLLLCTDRNNKKKILFGIRDESVLLQLSQLLSRGCWGTLTRQWVDDNLDSSFQALLEQMINKDMIAETTSISPQTSVQITPGIYRLQHASILYKTKTTGILIDPHFYSTYECHGMDSSDINILPTNLERHINAILISHSHGDHFHLPTLMMMSRTMPIIVPKVPRSTILCENMHQILCNLGFTNVIAVDWYSDPLVIGDIEVHILPFYGEQPLLNEPPQHPDLRNWGNTYVLKTQDYTSWLLIDSGKDSMGDMFEVASYVQRKFGSIDFLLSNLREFFIGYQQCNPFYISGQGEYWLSLSTEQIKRFPSMKEHCITLGAEGVAKICQILKVYHFLPYAHLWSSLGSFGQDELILLAQLQQALKEQKGCETVIFPWKIGEGYSLVGAKKIFLNSIDIN
jgi:hypothetical protein